MKAPRRVSSWETGPPGLAAAVSQSPGQRPWGRWERNWRRRRKPARHRRVVASRIWGWRLWTSPGPTGATPGGAMDREIYRSASRIGSGGKWRPPVAPGCRGSRGVPDGRGRRGAPRESECPKLFRKTEEGRKEEEVIREDKNGAHRRRRHPRATIPEPSITLLRAGDQGWGRAGTLPSS
jgi:hypothetical protein